MATRIVINGKEITNPAVKAAVGTTAVLFAGLIAAAIIFLVLPLVGIVVTLTVGLVGVILVALGVGIPIVILAGTFFGVLLAPFGILRGRKGSKKFRQLLIPPSPSGETPLLGVRDPKKNSKDLN